MKPITIYIGWARAASTAFRHNFLNKHPEIHAVGREQPNSDGPAALILNYLKKSSHAEFQRRLPFLRATWESYANDIDRMLCLADEELSIGLPTRPIESAHLLFLQSFAAACLSVCKLPANCRDAVADKVAPQIVLRAS